NVTGVQTCALPIWRRATSASTPSPPCPSASITGTSNSSRHSGSSRPSAVKTQCRGETMEITVAESKELYEQCLEIRKRVFVGEQNVPLDREIDEHEDFAIHILLKDDTPLGTVRYRPLSKDTI